MVNAFTILETAFTMLEMTQEFDKRLKYVGNPVYVGNGLSI